MKILIAGSEDFLGPAVARYLSENGHAVTRLVKSPTGSDQIPWEPGSGSLDASLLEGFDGVANLSMIGLPLRWAAKSNKKVLKDRAVTNALLSEKLAACSHKPQVLVCISGIGHYASAGADFLTEESPAAQTMFSQYDHQAEASTSAAAAAGIRVVHLRMPLVMGGFMLQFLGFQAGDGKQWFSWVGRDELASIVEFALKTSSLSGAVNAVSPSPLRNADFAIISSEALEQKYGGAMPLLILRMSMGDLGEEIFLTSRRLQPARLLAAGYRFRFPDLADCLRHERQYPDAVLPVKGAEKSRPVHA